MITFWSIILVLNQGTTLLKDLPAASTGEACIEIAENFLQEKPEYRKHVLYYGCIRKPSEKEV